MNVALVGTGRWGKVLLKNLVERFPDKLNISRYCNTGKKDNTDWMSSNYPGISRASYEDILSDPDLKAVFIATPIKTHFDLSLKAIRAGKHVFVEKPLAPTEADAELIAKEAKERYMTVLVDYTYVFHAWAEHLKKVLPRQTPATAYFQWRKFGTFQENIIDNLLSHDVAVATYLFGECAEVEEPAIDDTGDVISLLAYFGSCECRINIDRISHFKDKRIRISADAVTYDWNGDFLNGTYLNPGSPKMPLEKAFSHFLECIQKNEEPITGPSFEIKVASCLEKIRNKLPRP